VQAIAPSLIIIRIALDIDFKDYSSHDHPKLTPRKRINDSIFESELGQVVGGPGLPSAHEVVSIDVELPPSLGGTTLVHSVQPTPI
jgi:hypothetical protein